MESRDDVQQQLNKHSQRLQLLKQKKATLGLSADPSLEIEIGEIETTIKALQAQLEQLTPAPSAKSKPEPTPTTLERPKERAMSTQSIYAITGLLIGAATDLFLNILAAAIQQKTFGQQFSQQSLWLLGGLVVGGLLLGYWLGGNVQVKVSSSLPHTSPPAKPTKTVTVTRLKAYLSKIKIRGKGAHLTDVSSTGSSIDIDTRD